MAASVSSMWNGDPVGKVEGTCDGVEGLDASGSGGYEASRHTAMPATTIARQTLPGYWGRGPAATTSLGIVPS